MKWQLFAALLAYIVGVSAYDWILAANNDDLQRDEQNPIGRYLIALNGGDPSLFLRAKAAGTVVVCGFLALARRRWPLMADSSACVLALVQSWLLFCWLL